MCGITGIVSLNNTAISLVPDLRSMTAILKHRGPDDEGYLLIDTEKKHETGYHGNDTIEPIRLETEKLSDQKLAHLGFGFRRLSIIDLSSNGHQPMRDEATGNWIVFNGEIYNYLEIRDELQKDGCTFRTATDTEVILKSYAKWGVDCVNRFNGMWAFAIWDTRQKILFCSRDRFGVKPFYYFWKPGELFAFASEIKSLLELVPAEANYNALGDFFLLGISDHTEETFFKNIRQLRGAHSLLLSREGALNIFRYYDLHQNAEPANEKESIEKFRSIFFDAVTLRLRSDVPVGYALSGGIDSSSVVMAASQLSAGNNNSTFSTVYPGERAVDESFFIDKVLEKTNFKKNLVTPKAEIFLNDIENFIWHHEEPVSDLSYYAEFVLRRFTRQHDVIVSLEGQGADEVITGYKALVHPYLQDLLLNFHLREYFREASAFSRNLAVSWPVLLSNIPAATTPDFLNFLRKTFARLSSHRFIDFNFFAKHETVFSPGIKFKSRLNQMLYEFLLYTSIPNQLVRADKNAMAFSMECRFPFLDYRLVEFAFSLNANLKIRSGTTKFILREAMRNYLPNEVYERRDKKGFPVPMERWMDKDLRKFIDGVVSTKEFLEIPFLDKKKFRHLYDKYRDGKASGINFWTIIGVSLWHKKFKVSW